MDINNMEAEEIRVELKALGVKVHHKTGIDNLRETLRKAMEGELESVTLEEELPPNVREISAEEHVKRLTKEQRAMRMQRIVVSPNDPLMSAYNGLIFTVGSSAVNNGKMVKKYVPFNNDDGWHVPQIIIDQISHAEMQKFKQVTMPNGDKALQPYITKKFNVQILPPLTKPEMEILAAAQASKGAA